MMTHKKTVKFAAAFLAAVMALTACGSSSTSNLPEETEYTATEDAEETEAVAVTGESSGPKSYTYHDYDSMLVSDWNPHSYTYTQSYTFMRYLGEPLFTPTILDSENAIYQMAGCSATYIEDVTAEHQDDLEKYHANLPEQYDSYDEITENFVFEFGLNTEACWENGEPITADDYIVSMQLLLNPAMKNSGSALYCTGSNTICGANEYYNGETDDFDTVGLYKVDDYTFRMVLLDGMSVDEWKTNNTRASWLVYEPYYTAGYDTTGDLVTTNYATSPETTMSYGPYRLESYQADKQIVFVQNENWYGWEEDEDGTLVSYTPFEVDGEHVRQFWPTKIVLDVMTDDAAKQLYLNGELSRWSPTADDLMTYGASDRLYKLDDTYTSRIVFNTNLEALQAMDESKGNTNSVVLSNRTFRKAISLAMDRSELCTATDGYKPTTMLINNAFYTDIINDPESNFRKSDQAMEAMCRFYDVEWGEGTPYPTLKEAADSITGYNLTYAHELFEQAFDELVADGLYTPGEDIVVRFAYSGGSMNSSDQAFFSLLNAEINAAIEGTGFGTFTFDPYDNVANRQTALKNGEWAATTTAWKGPGGPYAYMMMWTYLDPDRLGVEESCDIDMFSEMWTIDIEGEPVTMSMAEWGRAINAPGIYSEGKLDEDARKELLGELETRFLDLYLCIPYAQQVANTMCSYQCQYYTDNYNPMYELGDLRLIQFNYDDDEWAAYVASQGGTLNYE